MPCNDMFKLIVAITMHAIVFNTKHMQLTNQNQKNDDNTNKQAYRLEWSSQSFNHSAYISYYIFHSEPFGAVKKLKSIAVANGHCADEISTIHSIYVSENIIQHSTALCVLLVHYCYFYRWIDDPAAVTFQFKCNLLLLAFLLLCWVLLLYECGWFCFFLLFIFLFFRPSIDCFEGRTQWIRIWYNEL